MHYPENNKLPEKQEPKMSIEEMLSKYEEKQPQRPSNLFKAFKSMQEFRQWCEEGTKEDLECTLRAFEYEELYEHCSIINQVLKSK